MSISAFSLDRFKLPLWPLWLGLLLLIVIVYLFNRSYVPIDETRYISVAWEMWLQGEWLVPHLNGIPYHHKPPLLFWLIHFGWGIFGVNEWWPFVLPGLFSLGCLWLTAQLARRLWPECPSCSHWAPLILLSCGLWALFSAALMFDILLSFFVLLGMLALIEAWQTKRKRSWFKLGIAIGLGILAKGPVILLHLLPIALIAPWWQQSMGNMTLNFRVLKANWRGWYLNLLISLGIGATIALIWAIPAGIAGGEEFRTAIFWKQSADRMVSSFAHERPICWYLGTLPIILFPWILWLPIWRAAFRLPSQMKNTGVRFCTAWFGLTFIIFSLISGKQPHYLLPLFPAFALLVSYFLALFPTKILYRNWDIFIPTTLILGCGIVFLVAPFRLSHHAVWVAHVSPISSLFLLLLGWLLINGRQIESWQFHLVKLSVISILFYLILSLGVLHASRGAYDLRNISQKIQSLQTAGHRVTHIGEYDGQYHFLGRLQSALPTIDIDSRLCGWLARHPKDKVIAYFEKKDKNLKRLHYQTDYLQLYRGKYVGILDAKVLYRSCQWNLIDEVQQGLKVFYLGTTVLKSLPPVVKP